MSSLIFIVYTFEGKMSGWKYNTPILKTKRYIYNRNTFFKAVYNKYTYSYISMIINVLYKYITFSR